MAEHYLAFWNVENLFGPEDHPHRIDWVGRKMASDLRGWTQAVYERKLDQLARIIVQMNDGVGPDILGVCEVEDRHVLLDLVAKLGPLGRNYAVLHADNQHDQRGIDTAFIYDADRYSADPDLIFSHFVIRRTGTRDILQCTFRTPEDRELILLANHWPSRSGGAIESAGFRATAGETLGYWHMRIQEEARDRTRACILAMGDFNDDPFDPSLRFNANSTRERGDVERARSAKFYNLAWEYLTWQTKAHDGSTRNMNGTLYHGSDGNVFDQILVGRPLLDGGAANFKVVDGSAHVVAFPEMVSHRTGEGSFRFGLPKGKPDKNLNLDGFADHFPIAVRLREA